MKCSTDIHIHGAQMMEPPVFDDLVLLLYGDFLFSFSLLTKALLKKHTVSSYLAFSATHFRLVSHSIPSRESVMNHSSTHTHTAAP